MEKAVRFSAKLTKSEVLRCAWFFIFWNGKQWLFIFATSLAIGKKNRTGLAMMAGYHARDILIGCDVIGRRVF